MIIEMPSVEFGGKSNMTADWHFLLNMKFQLMFGLGVSRVAMFIPYRNHPLRN